MMPAQTNGLNQLPIDLYPDGTALMNTLQQVSGAIGTAVAITIMSASQTTYLNKVTDPTSASAVSESLTAGVQSAFVFGLILAIAAHYVILYQIFTRSKRYPELIIQDKSAGIAGFKFDLIFTNVLNCTEKQAQKEQSILDSVLVFFVE